MFPDAGEYPPVLPAAACAAVGGVYAEPVKEPTLVAWGIPKAPNPVKALFCKLEIPAVNGPS